MYYAVNGGNWCAVRSMELPGMEILTSNFDIAVDHARFRNQLNSDAHAGWLEIDEVSHRYFILENEVGVRDTLQPEEMCFFPGCNPSEVMTVCKRLNNGTRSRGDYDWSRCSPIGPVEEAEPRQIRLNFLRAGYVWSNHGTTWFWAEEKPEWNGRFYSSAKKHQINLPWIKMSMSWDSARRSIAKVVK